MKTKTRKTFVLIVGGGPTGITAGLYLQKFGIPHILIEKDKILKKIPKAHYYNNQTMEVWRNICHIDKCVLNETENIHMWKNFNYCLNLNSDKIIGTYDNFYDKYNFKNTYYEDISPSKVTHLSQYKILTILYNFYVKCVKGDSKIIRPFISSSRLKFSSYRIIRQLLRTENETEIETKAEARVDTKKETKKEKEIREDGKEKGNETHFSKDPFLRFCGYDCSELLLGYEYESFLKWEDLNKNYEKKPSSMKQEDDSNFVITQVKNGNTGEKEIIISNYVFVAEGGKSSIKRDLNINDEKAKTYMKFTNIHFHSKQLSYLIRNNPAMLYFIFNEYIGVLVIHNFKEGEGVVHIPYISEKEVSLYADRTLCLKVLEKLLGVCLSDIQIHDIYKWTMNSSIASTFVDKRSNRIILLGDAAHKLPPSGGFGLNLGIGEVLNVIWKIGRIFQLKRNNFLNLQNKNKSTTMDVVKNNAVEQKTTNVHTIHFSNTLNEMNHVFSTLVNSNEKVQIRNFIDSYNVERKLVTEYTIDCAVRNYEKGNNVPRILGYEYNYIHFLKKWNMDRFAKHSTIFYYLFKSARQFLSIINNVPYILESRKKEIQQLFQNPSDLLTLLYPGVDLGYAYIDTIKETTRTDTHVKNVKKSDMNKESIFVKDKGDRVSRLKICEDVYATDMIPTITGSKMPHFIIYSFNKNSVYKLSTVDLPMINNLSFSYLILLFDYNVLKDVLVYLSKKKIKKDQFKICLWDSQIRIEPKGTELEITRDDRNDEKDKNKNTSNGVNDMNTVKIKNGPFVYQQKTLILGDISKLKGIELPVSNFEVSLVFSSKLIQDLFFETMHLKTNKYFVITRPDKHIISVGDENLLNQIEEIANVYI